MRIGIRVMIGVKARGRVGVRVRVSASNSVAIQFRGVKEYLVIQCSLMACISIGLGLGLELGYV